MILQLAKLKESFFFISKISSKPKVVYQAFQVVPGYCSRLFSNLCVCFHVWPCSSMNHGFLGHCAVVFQSFPVYTGCLLFHLSVPSRAEGFSASVRASAQAQAPVLIASHSPFFPRPEKQTETPDFLGSGVHWVLLTKSSDPALSSHPMDHSLSALSGWHNTAIWSLSGQQHPSLAALLKDTASDPKFPLVSWVIARHPSPILLVPNVSAQAFCLLQTPPSPPWSYHLLDFEHILIIHYSHRNCLFFLIKLQVL